MLSFSFSFPKVFVQADKKKKMAGRKKKTVPKNKITEPKRSARLMSKEQDKTENKTESPEKSPEKSPKKSPDKSPKKSVRLQVDDGSQEESAGPPARSFAVPLPPRLKNSTGTRGNIAAPSTMAGGAPVERQVTTAEEVEGVVSKSAPSIREGAGVEHTSPAQPGRGLEEERDPTSPRNNPEASGNISSEDARPSRPIFRESKKAFQKPREPSPYGRKLFAENVDVDPRYPIGGHGRVELLVTQPLHLKVKQPDGKIRMEQTSASAVPLYKTAYIKDSNLGCDVAGNPCFFKSLLPPVARHLCVNASMH